MTPLEVARTLQRCAVGSGQLGAGHVKPHGYRAHPNWAELEAIDAGYDPSAPTPVHPEGSWLAFVYSKPSFEGGHVHVHVLEVLSQDGSDSSEGSELWIKLKRPEAVAQALHMSPAPEASDVRGLLTGLAADLGALGGLPELGPDHELESGPEWLRTPLGLARQSEAQMRCPVTRTPLQTNPRFAGMLYLKIPSARWLMSG